MELKLQKASSMLKGCATNTSVNNMPFIVSFWPNSNTHTPKKKPLPKHRFYTNIYSVTPKKKYSDIWMV